ncbi:FtsX-like permease family protein [uncultured Microbacterium sp.]|uniref:ABC transporter permease n=1 Tax=uncultured Microbacterium sp. TaxID=191216 RepID=UPI0035CA038D
MLFRLSFVLSVASTQDSVGSQSGRSAILTVVATAFIVIALYVGAVVTTNTFATVIAGRTRTIALLRLLGATARSQRAHVAREGLVVGLAGGVVGAVCGLLISAAGVAFLTSTGSIPDAGYGFVDPSVVAPIIMVTATTWIASWIGSRRVLTVSPVEAIAANRELSQAESVARRGRRTSAIITSALGLVLLGLGVAAGTGSALGLLIALPGGVLSFTGILLGAHLIVPWMLQLCGQMFGRSAPAMLARANAVRYPERSTRTASGIIIGITLVSMFSVAESTLLDAIATAGSDSDGTEMVVSSLLSAATGLVGFAAVIAAVGMMNNLSLNVLQRTREIGLLRALGVTRRQIRQTITIESAQAVFTATLIGLLLGTIYGWVGAQSVLGTIGPDGILPLSIPIPMFGAIAAAASLLAITASLAPAKRATNLSPIQALAAE